MRRSSRCSPVCRFHTSLHTSRRGMEGCNPRQMGEFHTFHTFHTSALTCAYVGRRPHARTRARFQPLLGMEGMEGMEEGHSTRVFSFHTSATPRQGMEGKERAA